ncbi:MULTISPECIES: chemotaxis protein CheB [Mycobacterium avium complex (MAC)]|uniref:protein-glutamate methylesterase n=1 Tax=Mycobacterium colombiense TaxID=339268 RepID=A0A329LNU0_9MYCO|nr:MULTISPECIES: chemotaxis protein CheB [Mycobacterium avium complex (MAC)]OBG17928.1 chemotaxis protein CheB [Mycobacterium intracellulare]RAV08876.1 chemotaxis protein CheB [Mycobacterium colombiense]
MSATRHTDGFAPFGRVVLVASQGGMKALTTVVAGLPESFPLPVVLAQHRRAVPNRPDVLAEVVSRHCHLPVRVASHGEASNAPGVTIVPAGTIATIDDCDLWSLTTPSCNVGIGDAVLMSSAAAARTIAVILTGRLTDGAAGCRVVKRGGGRVLVQDPFTAEASSMPATAIATGCADFVLPLKRLATAVLALTTAPGAAELLTVPIPPWACLST